MFPVVQRFHLTPPPARKTSVLRKTCGKHVRVCLLLDIVKLPPWQHISTMRLVLKFMDVHKQKRPNISIRALIRRRTYTDRGNVMRPQMQFTSFERDDDCPSQRMLCIFIQSCDCVLGARYVCGPYNYVQSSEIMILLCWNPSSCFKLYVRYNSWISLKLMLELR